MGDEAGNLAKTLEYPARTIEGISASAIKAMGEGMGAIGAGVSTFESFQEQEEDDRRGGNLDSLTGVRSLIRTGVVLGVSIPAGGLAFGACTAEVGPIAGAGCGAAAGVAGSWMANRAVDLTYAGAATAGDAIRDVTGAVADVLGIGN